MSKSTAQASSHAAASLAACQLCTWLLVQVFSSQWDDSTKNCGFLDLGNWYEHYDGAPTIDAAKVWANPPYTRSPNEIGAAYLYTCSSSIKAICEFSSSLYTCRPPPSPPPPPPRPPSPPSPDVQSCGWRGDAATEQPPGPRPGPGPS